MTLERYRCIVADPAWSYNDSLKAMKSSGRGASSHYACMSLADIAGLVENGYNPALGGHQICGYPIADDAHLWLWITNGFLVNEPWQPIVKAWGFTPKTICTWVKGRLDRRPHEDSARLIQHIAQGHYLRNSTEHMVFCTRGKCPPLDRSIPTAFIAPRTRHSEKPEEAFRIVETVSPDPRLELFARRRREGWTAWGDEVGD